MRVSRVFALADAAQKVRYPRTRSYAATEPAVSEQSVRRLSSAEDAIFAPVLRVGVFARVRSSRVTAMRVYLAAQRPARKESSEAAACCLKYLFASEIRSVRAAMLMCVCAMSCLLFVSITLAPYLFPLFFNLGYEKILGSAVKQEPGPRPPYFGRRTG